MPPFPSLLGIPGAGYPLQAALGSGVWLGLTEEMLLLPHMAMGSPSTQTWSNRLVAAFKSGQISRSASRQGLALIPLAAEPL